MQNQSQQIMSDDLHVEDVELVQLTQLRYDSLQNPVESGGDKGQGTQDEEEFNIPIPMVGMPIIPKYKNVLLMDFDKDPNEDIQDTRISL